MGAVFDIFNSPNDYKINHAKWAGDQKMRDAGNQKEVAFAALKNFQSAESSKRRITAAGDEYNRMQAQIAKALNTSNATKMNTQLAAAQMNGALEAQAAAMGVGGSTVDLLNDLTTLKANVQLQANEDERTAVAFWGAEDAFKGLDMAWQAIDNSTHFANIDYTTQIEPTKLKNRWGAMIGIAVASYFGGPQAGQAAAETTMASYRAQNGDYEGSKRYMASAINNAAEAYQEWASLQDGEGKSKSWFQAVRDRNQESKAARAAAENNSKANKSNSSESNKKGMDTGGWGWGF